VVSLIVLGVMRVRNAKRCGSQDDVPEPDKQDLDWDNSALTVTVNPMHPDVSRAPPPRSVLVGLAPQFSSVHRSTQLAAAPYTV